VLNVVPPQKAGAVAIMPDREHRRPLVRRRLPHLRVHVHRNIHVIGDSIAAALPKSGHMANQTGKICAGAIVSLVNGDPVYKTPKFANTCYSFVSDKEAVNVAGVYRYDAEKKDHARIKESTGVSNTASEIEVPMPSPGPTHLERHAQVVPLNVVTATETRPGRVSLFRRSAAGRCPRPCTAASSRPRPVSS